MSVTWKRSEPFWEVEAMSELIMVGQSAQVLIDEIARLQALLKAYRDMLMRLYQDTVPPSGHCYRCGLWAGEHDENCAMAEVEELLALEFEEEDGNEWDDE